MTKKQEIQYFKPSKKPFDIILGKSPYHPIITVTEDGIITFDCSKILEMSKVKKNDKN